MNRIEIAARILANILATPVMLQRDLNASIHYICEGCLDAADALLKSADATKGVSQKERDLLFDLSKADVDLLTLLDLKDRAVALMRERSVDDEQV